jgi:hypothetical protein
LRQPAPPAPDLRGRAVRNREHAKSHYRVNRIHAYAARVCKAIRKCQIERRVPCLSASRQAPPSTQDSHQQGMCCCRSEATVTFKLSQIRLQLGFAGDRAWHDSRHARLTVILLILDTFAPRARRRPGSLHTRRTRGYATVEQRASSGSPGPSGHLPGRCNALCGRMPPATVAESPVPLAAAIVLRLWSSRRSTGCRQCTHGGSWSMPVVFWLMDRTFLTSFGTLLSTWTES